MKQNTHKQKIHNNPAGPKGKSKYALKLGKRKKFAARLGEGDAPYPVLRSEEEELEGPEEKAPDR